LHQRGYQISAQHSFVRKSGALLSSRFSYEEFDADTFPNSEDPYRLLVETTEGGFFNRRIATRSRAMARDLQSSPKHFYGDHQLKTGFDFSHSSYDGRQQFLPWTLLVWQESHFSESNSARRLLMSFTKTSSHVWRRSVDGWARLTLTLGLRFDNDSTTDSTHTAPRVGLTLALTKDRRTLLKAGGGLFYDRVPLNARAFPLFPDRTLAAFDPTGEVASSVTYSNVITGGLKNPRSEPGTLKLTVR